MPVTGGIARNLKGLGKKLQKPSKELFISVTLQHLPKRQSQSEGGMAQCPPSPTLNMLLPVTIKKVTGMI